MYFGSKMKFYFRVICSLGIQKPFALSQIYQVPILVLRNIGVFKTREFLQLVRDLYS